MVHRVLRQPNQHVRYIVIDNVNTLFLKYTDPLNYDEVVMILSLSSKQKRWIHRFSPCIKTKYDT